MRAVGRPGAHRAVAWGALFVVVGVFLALGSIRPSSPPTTSGRIAALDAEVRCPSCEGLSVASSSAASAVELRSVIAADVGRHMSDRQIEDQLVAHYGPQILLRPPTSGFGALVWFLPLAGFLVAAGGLGTAMWRRTRRGIPETLERDDRELLARALAEHREPGQGPASAPTRR